MTPAAKIGLGFIILCILPVWGALSYFNLNSAINGIDGRGRVTMSEHTSDGSKTGCRTTIEIVEPAEYAGQGVQSGACLVEGEYTAVIFVPNSSGEGYVGSRAVVWLKAIGIPLAPFFIVGAIYIDARRRKAKVAQKTTKK